MHLSMLLLSVEPNTRTHNSTDYPAVSNPTEHATPICVLECCGPPDEKDLTMTNIDASAVYLLDSMLRDVVVMFIKILQNLRKEQLRDQG
ncbi:hypothetical protein IFM46972_11477 [Aspergillus udagawae]|uniref:Uncharacterized protein n=1 Tax=Aspergillus udagawae TaxID=91492 RepID=A0A8H3XRV7_9EURO|nr:hypothetical protein IFM46972_11477 [Aspergillus udagawae]